MSRASSAELSDIERVRKRPAMYVGDTSDGSGIAHMIWEVLSNAIDQFLARECGTISVCIRSDGSISVEDDGQGIRTDVVDQIPFLQRVLTEMHGTATRDGHAPHEHVGWLRGVGLCPVNALSQWLVVDCHRDRTHYRQSFARGLPNGPIQDLGATAQRGTRITFLPDSEIFARSWLDPAPIVRRIRELAFLLPNLELRFSDERQHSFRFCDGIAGLVEERLGNRLSTPLFRAHVSSADIEIEVAAAWSKGAGMLDGYANIQPTSGGSHIQGIVKGLMDGLASVLNSARYPRSELRRVIEKGLVAVVQVRLLDPKFGAPTKEVLSMPIVGRRVSALLRPIFADFLRARSEVLDWLCVQLSDASNVELE